MSVYLNKFKKTLVLIIPKTSGFVKTSKGEDKNNKLTSFHIDHEKLLEKYKSICSKIKDLKDVELNALPVYDDRYIRPIIRTCGAKIYTNFRTLNVPEDVIECETFIFISQYTKVHKSKYYLQVYLNNCPYKIAYKPMTDYLDKIFSNIKYYKCFITIELI